MLDGWPSVQFRWRKSRLKLLTVALLAVVLLQGWLPVRAQELPRLDISPRPAEGAPAAQVHALPPSLAQWPINDAGDYFEQITPTAAGYLVWSRFPVRVFIEPIASEAEQSTRINWVTAVQQAVQEWNQYLPLTPVDRPEIADIAIWRRTPPLQFAPGHSAELGRVRSAETRYEIGIDRPPNAAAVLTHRFQIWLRPDQTSAYIQAAARHELGHALGIWGHSSASTDALYFSQVRNPPGISARDINTLQKIYQQPTRLGWALINSSNRVTAQ